MRMYAAEGYARRHIYSFLVVKPRTGRFSSRVGPNDQIIESSPWLAPGEVVILTLKDETRCSFVGSMQLRLKIMKYESAW